jgi:hypothetical protein
MMVDIFNINFEFCDDIIIFQDIFLGLLEDKGLALEIQLQFVRGERRPNFTCSLDREEPSLSYSIQKKYLVSNIG